MANPKKTRRGRGTRTAAKPVPPPKNDPGTGPGNVKVSARPVPKPSGSLGKGPGNVTLSAARPSFVVEDLPIGKSAPATIGSKGAHTIVYIHGIGNKPNEAVLKCQWDTALFGHPMGDRTRMAYWVNRQYYPFPEEATCSTPDRVRVDDDEITTHAIMALSRAEKGDEELAIAREVEALAGGNKEVKKTLEAIAGRMRPDADRYSKSGPRAKLLPFEWLRRFITPKLTRAFLRDVYDFLYVDERKSAMTQSFVDRLVTGGGPFVVVAHSQGSLIAYEVLRRLNRSLVDVELFLTIGSPLGIAEVQDRLRDWDNGNLKFPSCVRRWVNVADPADPVAIDPALNGEFAGGKIADVSVTNRDNPDHPHSGTGYLATDVVRREVRDATGSAFAQLIAPFAIAGDLVERLETGGREGRHPVLIELASASVQEESAGRIDVLGDRVENAIHDILAQRKEDAGAAEIDRLRRYISAKLTRMEIETLRSLFKELKLAGIWTNARKRALIAASTHTVQARPANLGYGADGRRITWAVLDTGICGDHPHFNKYSNVLAQYDCTTRGRPRRIERGDPRFATLDENGHGTHVAGIIAGTCDVYDPREDRVLTYSGMAPRCDLLGFKVLDGEGNGEDAWIIKALDTISSLNERSAELVVHGLNLSLGGNFDPSVFGTGHTPLCQELRRLWRQGVLVCIAAGNEGFAFLRGQDGIIQANMDLSIGDPANLEEAIAVGSVHKTNPHTYGISYFSSRGPTADGRRKPDVVAPGERIISARHDWRRFHRKSSKNVYPNRDDLYVEMSGTSMAAPHVSGILAAFLSLKREFIGYPDRVKNLLLAGCTDLGRDPYIQGAGLPNLIKMLALN